MKHIDTLLSACSSAPTFSAWEWEIISPVAHFLFNIAALLNITVGDKDAGTQSYGENLDETTFGATGTSDRSDAGSLVCLQSVLAYG